MSTCNYLHAEVCYNSRTCPVCDAMVELADAEKQWGKDADVFREQIASLKDELKEARAELAT